MKIHNIRGCASCGGRHAEIEFQQMEEPWGPFEYSGQCPETGAVLFVDVVDGASVGRTIARGGEEE